MMAGMLLIGDTIWPIRCPKAITRPAENIPFREKKAASAMTATVDSRPVSSPAPAHRILQSVFLRFARSASRFFPSCFFRIQGSAP